MPKLEERKSQQIMPDEQLKPTCATVLAVKNGAVGVQFALRRLLQSIFVPAIHPARVSGSSPNHPARAVAQAVRNTGKAQNPLLRAGWG